jgi:hypothetical protein
MLSSHGCVRRILGPTVVTLALCATTVGCGAAGKSGAAGKTFSGELCHLLSSGELAAAHIDAPCVQAKTSHTAYKTYYSAHWGANAEAQKFHSLQVSVEKFTGPGASLRLEPWRRKLQPGGLPFKVKGIGSVLAETFSTVNPSAPPPKRGELPAFVTHKRGEARFVVGNYLGMIVLYDDNPSASEKDLEQALIPIAQTVAAEL